MQLIALAGLLGAAAVGCGGSNTTTVIKQASPVTVTQTVTKTRTQASPEPQATSTSCQNPSGSAPIHELVATGVDCTAASGVAGAWASAGTSCQTGTCSAAGFSCTSSQPSPSAEFLSVRCISGNETVTFDSGG